MSSEAPAVAGSSEGNRPFQFHLIHLLMLPVGLALFLGIGLWLHWAVAIFLVLVCAIAYPPTRTLAVVVGTLGMLVALFLPSIESARGAARRASCVNKLKQIELALHCYHDAHGCFPPAVVTDAQGRPMHSWRVLILPYFEQKQLYKQYRLDEPWDGPNNKKLHGTILSDLLCPEETNPVATNTSYLAVTGPGTAWRTNRGVALGDIADNPSSTIMVVEVVNSGVHWMEPVDLDVQKMAPGINPKSGKGISSLHPAKVANVAFADGTVRSLPEDLPLKDLQAMLTIAGGEEVVLDEW